MKVTEIYQANPETIHPLPLFLCSVQAGFPSPADDYIEKKLDLNELMIKHPAATFFVKVEGESMCNAGIHTGDILVVDKSLQAAHGKIVVAIVNGEFTVKRMWMENRQLQLVAENEKYPPIKVGDGVDFQVWGVVTYVIHKIV